MDNRTVSAQKDQYPYLTIAKCVVFVALATFVLYLPLGDPHSAQAMNKKTIFGAGCCLCDLYDYLILMCLKTSEVIQYLVDVIKDVLYDAKMQFYGLLHKFDGHDLCRFTCTEEWEEDVNEDEPPYQRQRRRPVCRCIKRKCSQPLYINNK